MSAVFDTHCHLDFAVFDMDRHDVMERARRAGVTQILVPGTQRRCQAKLMSLCAEHGGILRPAVGLHPYFINEHQSDDLAWMSQLLADNPGLPVGEIGLDKTCDNFAFQQQLFEEQVALAAHYERPVILHHRKTLDTMLPTLRRVAHKLPAVSGVVHAFSGSEQQARAYIELGFKLGVGGVITYARAKKTRATIQAMPLSALVLETDAPDMPLCGHQGERNEPAHCVDVLQSLYQLRAEPDDEVKSALWRNSLDLFGAA